MATLLYFGVSSASTPKMDRLFAACSLAFLSPTRGFLLSPCAASTTASQPPGPSAPPRTTHSARPAEPPFRRPHKQTHGAHNHHLFGANSPSEFRSMPRPRRLQLVFPFRVVLQRNRHHHAQVVLDGEDARAIVVGADSVPELGVHGRRRVPAAGWCGGAVVRPKLNVGLFRHP